MKQWLLALLLVGLVVLQQDYWQWGETRLVAGFLPRTLAYHMVVSLLAAAVWLYAACCCWPADEALVAPAADPGDRRDEAAR